MASASVARRLRKGNPDFRLPLVLRFSNRRMRPDLNGTIWQHQRIISTRGYCWWAWWRAQNAFDLSTDPSGELGEMLSAGPVKVGLYSKSLGRAYIAEVSEVITSHGSPILTPERAATPGYYSSEAFPAWFKITSIERIDGAPITELSEVDAAESPVQIEMLEDIFRNLESVNSTMIWLDDEIEPSLPTLEVVSGSGVLHMSDLHFGPHHSWKSSGSTHPANLMLSDALEQTLERHGVDADSIGVIVVSGDISDQGPSDAYYSDALGFFNRAFALLGLTARNLVIVPGNHDVTRHVIHGQEPSFDFAQRQYDDRLRQAEQAYNDFCHKLFGYPSAIQRIRRFKGPHAELNFLQLNSTLPRDQYNKEYGFLGLAPIRPLEHLRRLRKDAMAAGDVAVNIAVQHHHIISTVKEEYVPPTPDDTEVRIDVRDPVSTMVDQSNLIDWATQYKLRLLLHGHQHKVKNRMISDRFSNDEDLFLTDIIGAGSAGASWRPDNEPMSFNIYDFKGEFIHVKAFGMDREMGRQEPLRSYRLRADGQVSA